ncbi:MobA/MobL family protein [Clostridium tyrobutyricum]|uniref:MobQ family relaxase n=1 Tax=Clostridium tyrobutyricum TaxID=1519 RepID=UPI001C38BEFD|nr:MobQ family relaxase [Clostridium tyrobutyricum]MBV4420415.1 MobA/MobL family protein [Clostridium tyrobutyricum]
MAIYHFSGQIISRSNKQGRQRSAVACAAYRSGEKLHDERSQSDKFYKRKVQPVTMILVPKNAPSWVSSRERLWNEVEKKEKQYNSQLAREFNIALPKELSNEEQEKLTYDFCKKNFVDNGMVADIAIHRDNKDNPHFHVMLTIRPFDENGKWKAKCRKEIVTDKKTGRKKSMRINTVDWNDKNKMKEWRKSWEDFSNRALKGKGISISSKSNRELGKEVKPTIHEGYAARNMVKKGKISDRVNSNKRVREYNRTVIELKKYKQERERNLNNKKFYSCLTKDEVKNLCKIAKYLKTYINIDTIERRKEQLKNWNKSLKFKDDTADKIKALNRIEKEEAVLSTAENILENRADKFISKYYKNLDIGNLTKYERIYLVDTTLRENKILDEKEIERVKRYAQNDILENYLKDILNNRIRFSISIKNNINHLENLFNEVEDKYNISLEDIESVKNAPKSILRDLKRITLTRKQLKESLTIMNKIYDNQLEEMYPNWENRVNLTIEEKEVFIMAKDYYRRKLKADDFKISPRKYNKDQQTEILGLLKNDRKTLKQKYTDFKLSNKGFVYMFYAECASHADELDSKSRERINEYFDRDNYLKDFNVYRTNNKNNYSDEFDKFDKSIQEYKENISSPKHGNLLFDSLRSLINQVAARNRNQLEREKELKLKRKRKRRRNIGL